MTTQARSNDGGTVRIRIVPWTWADGTVHLEVRSVALFDDDTGDLVTHVDNNAEVCRTVCGVSYFGALSASGLAHAERVTCETCRLVLASMTFTCEHANVCVVTRDDDYVRT